MKTPLHHFFQRAKYEIEIKDRFVNPVKPREWFLSPLPAIDEAVEPIEDGPISKFHYYPATALKSNFHIKS